jgi:hypothetical protein
MVFMNRDFGFDARIFRADCRFPWRVETRILICRSAADRPILTAEGIPHSSRMIPRTRKEEIPYG